MRKLLYAIFILSYFAGKAQPGKEAWHWYFGNGCKIDFSSGTAVVGTGPLYTLEGSACLSDPNTGQLLMYSNGIYVENSTNQTMYNGVGLLGNQSTTQSALIVPKPSSSTIFYIFTASASELTPHGVHYSIADITLHNGHGEVTVKNQLLTLPPATEKITAVKHCNGTDYWVITHSYLSDAYNTYLVTSAGVNTVPVVSHVGTFIQDTINNPHWWEGGYLKASPNGKKLAFAEADTLGFLEILDFNNSTGVITNPMKIMYTDGGIYGTSFSPDNSKLYAATLNYSPALERIYQYDLSSNNLANIIASQTILADSLKTEEIGAMQMAPDGKIYIARNNVDTLGVINNPNNLGVSCNLQMSGFPLAPNTKSQYGLPNFIDANYAGINLNIPNVQQCSSFPIDTLNAGVGFVSYQWSTGATTNSIVINSPGKYWVTVVNQQGCSKTDTAYAYLIEPVKKDTNACALYTANATQNAVLTYNWYDGVSNPVRTFTTTGSYWIDISYIGGCAVKDTFNIVVNPLPIIHLGTDTTFCLGNLPLNAFNPSSTYNWNSGQTTSSITATKAGSYWVKVTNQYGCTAYDTLVVYPKTSLFNFEMPNIVTPNNDGINDGIDFGKYQFSSMQLEIYDRWGLKVFESTDANCIWKPTINNKDGTYFANIQYRIDCGIDSQTKNIKTFITLIN
jgi:gliding motility-associated-like protein